MLTLLVANLKIMLRDRQALFWALFFPLVLVLVFGIFDLDGAGAADMAIIDHDRTSRSRELQVKLADIDYLNLDLGYGSEAAAGEDLRDGDIEYLLIIPEGFGERFSSDGSQTEPVSLPLYFDINNEVGNQLIIPALEHLLDEENLKLVDSPRLLEVAPQGVEAREIDYFDVLLIGLVGMGMMTNSIIFIAVKISLYRNQSVLKRILATPLRVRYYFVSEIVAHLALSLVQAGVVIAVGVVVFGANIHGNVFWLFVIVAFANTVFLNIGFIISGWATSPRSASGMGNAIAIPMLFFSGTFFPTSSLPAFLPELVSVLPLKPVLDAMRQVSIDGLHIWDVWEELAMVAGWLVVSSVAAIKLFKFG